MANRFTVVCDFDGGTYVSQVLAADARQALAAWATHLRQEQPISVMSDEIAAEVQHTDDEPAPLEGLSGAWCWSATVGGKLALATIVHSA